MVTGLSQRPKHGKYCRLALFSKFLTFSQGYESKEYAKILFCVGLGSDKPSYYDISLIVNIYLHESYMDTFHDPP